MSNVDTVLLAELEKEKSSLGGETPHTLKLLIEEIDRVQKGQVEKYKAVHHDRPIKITEKILIPVKEFPKFNFAGKLLGPKGSSLKKLQEDTGSKMSILGRGVMRDRNKEEELRKQGGKFAHLNEEQHVLVEVFAHPVEAYQRLGAAVTELRRYLVPDYNDDIGMAQRQEMGMTPGQNGASHGGPPQRGRGRGGPGRGAPGGMRGRGASLMNAPGGRGGAQAPRGAPRGRGGMGAPRAPAPARHEPPAPKYEQDYGSSYGSQQSFDNYQAPSYQESSYEQTAGASYDYQDTSYQDQSQSYDQGGYEATTTESQYYDYGGGASSRDQGFGGDQGYGDSWQSQTTYGKAPSSGGRGRGGGGGGGEFRSHPYSAPASRGARY